jgi:hypothetical protein
MNIVQLQDQLKNFSQDQLVKEMQMPSGNAPPYLVLSEIMRRKQMETAFSGQQAPQETVAQEAVAAAGVPQGGIADMARALAPQTDMTQNTGVQAMAKGGPVKKMQEGGAVMTDPAVRTLANRMGMTVEEYLSSVGPERAAAIRADADRRAASQVTSSSNVFDPRLAVTGTQAATGDMSTSFEQQKDDSLFNELGVNPSRTFGGADEYDRGMPELPTLQETFAADNPLTALRGDRASPRQFASDMQGIAGGLGLPALQAADASELGMARLYPEQPGMNTGEEALNAARARGGEGGILDALLAGGAPQGMQVNAGRFLPRPEDLVAPQRPADPMADFSEDFGMSEGAGRTFDLRIPRGESTFVEPMSGLIEAGQNAEGGGSIMDMIRRALPARTSAPPPAEDPGFVEPMSGMINQVREQNAAAAAGPDMEELARQSAEDAAQARDAAGITESRRTPTTAPAAEPAQPSGGGGGGGGGAGGGAGGTSSYEQALMDALASREKAATQDKWLALAQVGLNMMSSRSPTLLGAIGESGLKGVETARAARDQYDKDKLDILGAIEQSRLARAAAAARAASGAGGAAVDTPKPINATILGQYMDQLEAAKGELSMLIPPSEPSFWTGAVEDPDFAAREALKNRIAGLEQAIAYAYATHGAPYVGTSEPTLDGDVSD